MIGFRNACRKLDNPRQFSHLLKHSPNTLAYVTIVINDENDRCSRTGECFDRMPYTRSDRGLEEKTLDKLGQLPKLHPAY